MRTNLRHSDLRRRLLVILWLATLATACTSQRTAPPPLNDLPSDWQGAASEPVEDGWLATLAAPYLQPLVDEALARNREYAQAADSVAIAWERVRQLRADRLPSLSLALDGSRARPAAAVPITEQVEVSASSRFEIDLWGRLSDAQRQAALDYAAQQARLQDIERRLVADVVSATFDVISASQLLSLFEQRLSNLLEGLDIIEQRYRSGLNEALDVYLAQTTVQQERANIASQQQQRFAAATDLELLLARYPSALSATSVTSPLDLPQLQRLPALGIPADLIKRRPDVQQAWYQLLSADAALAVAHKNRFPQLVLSGSAGDTDSAVSRLLDGGKLSFAAAASLVQPLFQGGRLQSLHKTAQLRVAQAEQRYLEVVYDAFAQVENELHRAGSLEQRIEAFLKAQANAEAALKLATDQYQRGLVPFTTVLESQRRAFDAQTTVVQLRNQRLQNRIALLLALGGNY